MEEACFCGILVNFYQCHIPSAQNSTFQHDKLKIQTNYIFIDDSSERGFASNTSVCTVLDSMDNGILVQHHTHVSCDGTCDAYAYKHFHIYGIQIDLGQVAVA